jgi:ribulose-phosphate 3-epimerase
MSIKIAPSILSADFGRLAEQVQEAEEGGADWIHVDVMDGRFVPNITIGPLITKAVREATDLPVDVHLMIADPERYVEAFRDAGADVITVHQEACPHLHGTLQQIRDLGALAGVALNPSSPVSLLSDVVELIDLLLVMTVNPGFGGQAYIPSSKKVRAARQLLDGAGRSEAHLQVDGGVDPRTATEVAAAGADVLVAGSAIFRASGGIATAIAEIRNAAMKSHRE